ncbi:unnamed protein product [Didymodactylos carnosus]|uniref:Uncharacterized protein n=1 Tax=Didymodactylos carnosus TaxID=1234261 RepID=A0A814XXV9_9BILA|nr:unnamed protein product [Didymodactylos carnosus]CAF1485476.1 unnamed protein product [Didymodactylos carnosus]CAF3985550.1 unnamed protein product [Didymodactylos carnosus]CAF4275341.1 unnamed protein product [Didymodactylos carnosus]
MPVINNKVLCDQCLSCRLSSSCYECYNKIPNDLTNIEIFHLICTKNLIIFKDQQKFYSIIKQFSMTNCTMHIFYFDQFTMWNYLDNLSLTYAKLNRLSSKNLHRTPSIPPTSPILYTLKTLNLSHNSLRTLTKEFSYYLPSLVKLDLSFNHLLFIKRKTFSDLLQLEQLYLNDNYLKRILINVLPKTWLNSIDYQIENDNYILELDKNPRHCTCNNLLRLMPNILQFKLKRDKMPLCHSPIIHVNRYS